MSNKMLYKIQQEKHNEKDLKKIISEYPEIKFVSLMGIDLYGNGTEEKIPITIFLKNINDFLEGIAVQTDGSSVALPGIATLNDAKIDMIVDKECDWFIDYNYSLLDEETNKPVGTIVIPAFLQHGGVDVDSRSILKRAEETFKSEILKLIKENPNSIKNMNIETEEIKQIELDTAAELEFWVKTPNDKAEIEALTTSECLQEQYWTKINGPVRTALEETLICMDKYQLEPEMGHKECGGVRGQMDTEGHMTHVMEQLEIDWKYSEGLQTADNELLARIIVKEVFRMNGLEVSFQAKPIIGVAGSGEHVHVGLAAKLKNGKMVNLMAPSDMKEEFLSAVGYGAIMGLLKNYEVLNPFISSTNDSLNRLKPGFEAPVCIVTSLGHAPSIPSRNRTILAGLVRDIDNPMATRIEMRSPNPFTNTYLALAVFYLSLLDGVKACVNSGKDLAALEAELSKQHGVEGFYLEKDREYRTENDVFEDFTEEERSKLFGKPPATVWENMMAFKEYPEKTKVLTQGNILKDSFIHSFAEGALIRWKTELLTKLIPDNLGVVMNSCQLHESNVNSWDDAMWDKIQALRTSLAQNTATTECVFTRIKKAVNVGDYGQASALQLEMSKKIEELQALYHDYSNNIID